MTHSMNRRRLLAGATATTACTTVWLAAPALVRAQPQALKIAVLLPRSGYLAQAGQSCHRGAQIAGKVLSDFGYRVELTHIDIESSPEIARTQAEKMINEGAHCIVGAFDSACTLAIAQVCEQRQVPLSINIAAAPPITEQGYRFVFRNFPTAGMILSDAFANQKELFGAAGTAPKSVVFLHVNDTFGTSMAQGIGAILPKFDLPYRIAETIAYDPTARDLSVEIAKAKATGADGLLLVSRLNDAILLTRELVKQRWSPMAVLSMGPGWYEDQYLKTLGKLADGPMSFVPWYDPNKRVSKLLEAALAKAHPGVNLNTNHIFTFEALQVAADATKRAASTDPKAVADAIRKTNITDNVSIGPGIQFDEKGQNDKLKNAAIQNRGGKLVTIAPKAASNAKAEIPMTPYDKRG
jgi:branched-chain amino acid transport system substrate-binding protein